MPLKKKSFQFYSFTHENFSHIASESHGFLMYPKATIEEYLKFYSFTPKESSTSGQSSYWRPQFLTFLHFIYCLIGFLDYDQNMSESGKIFDIV